ncbi:MAG: hypothetical protein RIS70_935 [Planctomycetota bacterium]
MSPHLQVLVYFAPLIVLVVVYPSIIRSLMRLRPMADRAFLDQLIALASQHRLRIQEFVIWQTGGRYENAAVVGALPWNRFVVLTDGLLGNRSHAELSALVRHELAHAQRSHVLMRVLLVALPLWCWLWGRSLVPATWEQHLNELWQQTGMGWSFTTVRFLAVPAVLVLVLRLALGKLSRFLEHDADLCGCDCYSPHASVADRSQACHALQRALEAIVPRAQRDRSTWLHPSTRQRIAVLEASVRDERFADRIRRRTEMLGLLLPLAYVAAPLVAAWPTLVSWLA